MPLHFSVESIQPRLPKVAFVVSAIVIATAAATVIPPLESDADGLSAFSDGADDVRRQEGQFDQLLDAAFGDVV